MSKLNDVYAATLDPQVAESGGLHNQKGIDFQRYWSLWRALELEASGCDDFLFLFESVQDLLELDSESTPTAANIYQLKKKDSGEWTWKELTALDGPPSYNKDGSVRKKKQAKDPSTILSFIDSPVGKLSLSANALSSLTVKAFFISNAGCSVPLATPPGGTAASAQECSLAQLEQGHAKRLTDALATLGKDGGTPLPLDRFFLHRTVVHPDSPEDAVVARTNDLLASRSPKHAAQARTLVRSLFGAVSAKSRNTGLCVDFAKLRLKRGFGKSDLKSALADLEKVPDLSSLREAWLGRLNSEGMDLISYTRLTLALSSLDRERLTGRSVGPDDEYPDIRAWVQNHPPASQLTLFLGEGEVALKATYPQLTKTQLHAYLLNEGIRLCVDQISGS